MAVAGGGIKAKYEAVDTRLLAFRDGNWTVIARTADTYVWDACAFDVGGESYVLLVKGYDGDRSDYAAVSPVYRWDASTESLVAAGAVDTVCGCLVVVVVVTHYWVCVAV